MLLRAWTEGRLQNKPTEVPSDSRAKTQSVGRNTALVFCDVTIHSSDAVA